MVLHYLRAIRTIPKAMGWLNRPSKQSRNCYKTVFLSFRTTPILWCSFSPAELLMGRQLRTDIPTPKNQLIPQWSYRNFKTRTVNIRLSKGRLQWQTQSKATGSTSPWYPSVDKNRTESNNWSHPIPSKYIKILHCHHYRWPRA